MFILRRLTKGKIEANTCLGIEYVIVYSETNKSEFEERVKLWSASDIKGIYAIIVFNDGSNIMPLYKGSHYYIMTSDGKTFDNVTMK